MEQLYFINIWG